MWVWCDYMCVSVCVSVCERESECVCVCACVHNAIMSKMILGTIVLV